MRLKVWTKAITGGSWFRVVMPLAFGLICTNAALGNDSLFPGRQYVAGDWPNSVAIGDLNGDQVPDVVVANQLSHDVSVLLGAGDGTFVDAVHFAVGYSPRSVAIGDLDGDQVPDLAVANASSDNVSVLLGVGDGTFAAAVHYAAGEGPAFVAIGDLNGDQVPDLAVANRGTGFYYDGGEVSVLLGIGDGTFAPAVNYPTGNETLSVAIGDLNGDQVPDLAVANEESDNVSVLWGVGDGTFAAAEPIADVYAPMFVAIGDLNGDQVLDLAVPRIDFKVSILLGVGDGTFAAPVDYVTTYYPFSLAIGDLNGDQVPDLAVANEMILLGVGDGTFAAAFPHEGGYFPKSVAIADLDGDQVADLVYANSQLTPGTVTVLLGVGDGTFAAAVPFESDRSLRSVAIGDLNSDQVLDLTVVNYDSDEVYVLLGIGDGTFAAALHYAVGEYPSSVAIGDFNGDLVPDLAVVNYYSASVSVLLGVGDGTFSAALDSTVSEYPKSVAIGDFNGDLVQDLAVVDYYADRVSVFLGVGDGTFTAASQFTVARRPTSVAIGDLNGDQVPDLAVASEGVWPDYDNKVSIFLGVCDGTFADAVYVGTGSTEYSSRASGFLAIGDLNGDRVPDLAVTHRRGNTVSVLLGVGDGTFAAAAQFATRDEPWFVAIDDVDGDLVPDLAVAAGSSLSVLPGVGDGTFAAPQHYAGRGRPAIGDLDGDLMPDVAFANSYLLNLSLRDCNGNGTHDQCDIACGPTGGTCDLPGCGQSDDCNCNDIPDECEIHALSVVDCTAIPGACDDGPFFCTSDCVSDANGNGIPDCCDADTGRSACPDCCVMAADSVEVFFAAGNFRCHDDRPDGCAIDSGEPHDIGNIAARHGWDRMVMSFSCNLAAFPIGPEDFSVRTMPAGVAPSVSDVVIDGSAGTATVILDDMITPGEWTCIEHSDSGNEWCMGYLPADASQDGLSAAADINALIDAINLVPGLELPDYATDINRSGVTNGQDILRLIDLLNGAGDFDPWMAKGLPPCPSVGNGR